MAYIKKISGNQFSKDVINFMLKKYNVTYDDIKNLPNRPDDVSIGDDSVAYSDNWFRFYVFDNFEEYIAYKEYFYVHYKEYAPKRNWKRRHVDDTFNGFDMMYGLKVNYDFDEHWNRIKEIDMYTKVFGKNKK
jgi:hypothetical protein